MPVSAQEILDFWFDPTNEAHWFAASEAFDGQIRQRFFGAAEAAAAGQLDGWVAEPSHWLALLILLDQFPRNLHRGTAGAWAQDASAQRIALAGIARGDDRQLPPLWRVFAYLPLEHAENMPLQDHSVALFETLQGEVSPGQHPRFAGFLDYARRHRDVIARFGRFPHRNAILGRTNTPDEIIYLAQPGAGF